MLGCTIFHPCLQNTRLFHYRQWQMFLIQDTFFSGIGRWHIVVFCILKFHHFPESICFCTCPDLHLLHHHIEEIHRISDWGVCIGLIGNNSSKRIRSMLCNLSLECHSSPSKCRRECQDRAPPHCKLCLTCLCRSLKNNLQHHPPYS